MIRNRLYSYIASKAATATPETNHPVEPVHKNRRRADEDSQSHTLATMLRLHSNRQEEMPRPGACA